MTRDPFFLELDEVLEIHLDQVRRYGGSAEVRDLALLDSAVAMPKAGSRGEYFHSDLFEMAAAYLFHIVKNHPFLDGNKRTGAATALVFLELNGIRIKAPPAALVRLVLGIAKGGKGKWDAASFLKRHSVFTS